MRAGEFDPGRGVRLANAAGAGLDEHLFGCGVVEGVDALAYGDCSVFAFELVCGFQFLGDLQADGTELGICGGRLEVLGADDAGGADGPDGV